MNDQLLLLIALLALKHVAQGVYAVFRLARNPDTGIYIDHATLAPGAAQNWAQGSVEYTGLGMMAECVAVAMGWTTVADAQGSVLQSLQALLGGVAIPRTPQGFYAQFFDSTTGAIAQPYFGLMPSGLMAAGALFARAFFRAAAPEAPLTAAIDAAALELWHSVDWPALLCDENGVLSPNGTGVPMLIGLHGNFSTVRSAVCVCVGCIDDLTVSTPRQCAAVQYPQADGYYEFNEEHYVVWFAYLAACGAQTPHECRGEHPGVAAMWERWLGRRKHPDHAYAGHPLLSLWSGYIVQLPFYSCASFNSDPAYVALFESHWQADSAFYADAVLAGARGRTGLGAGPTLPWCASGDSYAADRLDVAASGSYCRTFSPYVSAGYLAIGGAVQREIATALTQLMADGDTVAPVPGTPYHILWRRALLAPDACVF
jgi:hypothetical protein